MKITLTQDEIVKALVDYVGSMDIQVNNRHIQVDLNAGATLSAIIEISSGPINSMSGDAQTTSNDMVAVSTSEDPITPATIAGVAAPITGVALETKEVSNGFGAPAEIPRTPEVETPVEAPEAVDREKLKAELDSRNIEYAPKARTGTLQALLEEAKGNDPVTENTGTGSPPVAPAEVPAEAVVEEPSLFGANASPPTAAPAKEVPPFDMNASAATPAEVDRPLFGS